ncbi:MAG: hypothetical protein HQL28_04890 [Candidatus Omnitrophica bacterium]|nr:hypothetical protein [Candidatus Omnitrophota bacterium]
MLSQKGVTIIKTLLQEEIETSKSYMGSSERDLVLQYVSTLRSIERELQGFDGIAKKTQVVLY